MKLPLPLCASTVDMSLWGHFLFKPPHLVPWLPQAHGRIAMQNAFNLVSKVPIAFQSLDTV